MFRQIAARSLIRSTVFHSTKKAPPFFDFTTVADTGFEVFNAKEYVQSRRNMECEIKLGKREYYVYLAHYNGRDLLHIRHWFKNNEGILI